MKSTVRTFVIAFFSAFASILVYDYFTRNSPTVIEQPVAHSFVPAKYNVSNSLVAAEDTDFTAAVEKTIDAVVHVKNTSIKINPSLNWYDLFYGRNRNSKSIGMGSGVIVSPDGYIITNYHVIKDHTEIEVTSNDNRTYKAKLIGSDSTTDIAILKIDADTTLPFVLFGDSDAVKIGEWVLAVGNPFNLNSTVTAGIISAKSRDLNQYDRKNESYIQTDAAVNMGNSGGALVNTHGELIGINTAISSITGGYVGYSFAVPSNIARKVFEDILEYGNVQKGLLGVSGMTLNSKYSMKLETDETEGFYISEIEEGLGADLAGLKPSDVIKSIDGVKINKFADLTGYLSTKRPGDKVQIAYIRDRKKHKATVTLEKIERATFYGLYLKNLSASQKRKYNIDKGVIVTENQNRELYYYGIGAGHIILEINSTSIYDVQTLSEFKTSDLKSILFLSPDGERERIIIR